MEVFGNSLDVVSDRDFVGRWRFNWWLVFLMIYSEIENKSKIVVKIISEIM